MKDELKSNAITQAQPVIEALSANPKAAMAVGTATASAGIDAVFLQVLPIYLGLIATALGIILSTVLIYRNVMLTIQERQEFKQRLKTWKDDNPV